MAFYRERPTYFITSTQFREVWRYTNNAKRNLFVNRFDIILPPQTSRHFIYRLKRNGVTISEILHPPHPPLMEFPVRNLIGHISRDDEISLEVASTNPYGENYTVTLLLEFDFADAPYPAITRQLTNADLAGLTETRRLVSEREFDQTFDSSDYAYLDMSGYTKLLALIRTDESYDPDVIDSQTAPLTQELFSLLAGASYGNATALTRSPNFPQPHSNFRPQYERSYVFTTLWRYLDNSEIQTYNHAITEMTQNGAYPVKEWQFDIEETGRFLLQMRNPSGTTPRFRIYPIRTPFDINSIGTVQNKSGDWNLDPDSKLTDVDIIDRNLAIMVTSYSDAGATKLHIWGFNPHFGESAPAQLLWDRVLTVTPSPSGGVGPTLNFTITAAIDGLSLNFAWAASQRIYAGSLITETPFDFRNATLGTVTDMDAPADVGLSNLQRPRFSHTGMSLVGVGRSDDKLHQTATLPAPFTLTGATWAHERTIPRLQETRFRFDDSEFFTTQEDTRPVSTNSVIRRYDFPYVAPGFVLRAEDGMPFLPFGYKGTVTTNTIRADLHNPNGESRGYRISLHDDTTLETDFTFLRMRALTLEIFSKARAGRVFVGGSNRITRRQIVGTYSTARWTAQRAGMRIWSNNIQTLKIYGLNEGESPQLLRTVGSFSGTQTVDVSTDKAFLLIRKEVAFNFNHEPKTENEIFEEATYDTVDNAQIFVDSVAAVNALPTEGTQESPHSVIGYVSPLLPPGLASILIPFMRVTKDSVNRDPQMHLDSLRRLPILNTTINVAIEGKTRDGTYQTINPNIGQILPSGETAIALTEENAVFPKGNEAMRFKITASSKIVLSLDVILSN